MTIDRYREFVVTRDSELLDKLWARFSELGTFGLATYAYTLGLYPPDYEEGQYHTIHQHSPHNGGGRTYLVWSAGFDSPEATYLDQAREEADDDDDEFDDGTVWGELFPEGLQRIEDQGPRRVSVRAELAGVFPQDSAAFHQHRLRGAGLL